MTRRAEVWREAWGGYSKWHAATHRQPRYVRHHKRIAERNDDYLEHQRSFDTHAEALAYALERVGLAPTARYADTPTTTKETP